jgi:hypothetical protein
MGLEPRRGDTVHVSGGGESNTPARLAVDSDYAASRRDYARWVAGEIEKVSRRVDRVRQGLERNVGPTPGFRQPKDTGNGRTKVTADELTVSLLYQGIRLRRGAE